MFNNYVSLKFDILLFKTTRVAKNFIYFVTVETNNGFEDKKEILKIKETSEGEVTLENSIDYTVTSGAAISIYLLILVILIFFLSNLK